MRDNNLDIIKGLACILMVFAHSQTLGKIANTFYSDFFWYLGFFAPVLFFGSVGVSIVYQLKKRSFWLILIFNLFLLLISFADRGKESLNYVNFFAPNLIGSIALATIFIAILRRYNSLFIFIGMILLDRILNRFQITPTILYGIPFALIPWAAVTALGKFLFERPVFKIWILATGSLITFYSFVLKNQIIEDQFITTLFLGMSMMIYSFSAIIAPYLLKNKSISSLLSYLGENTLLFYWVHLFILFQISFKLPPVEMWSFILFESLIFMWGLQQLNKYTFEKVAQTNFFWKTLIGAIFLPILLKTTPEFNFYYFSTLTFIFALNYHQFFKLKEFKNL